MAPMEIGGGGGWFTGRARLAATCQVWTHVASLVEVSGVLVCTKDSHQIQVFPLERAPLPDLLHFLSLICRDSSLGTEVAGNKGADIFQQQKHPTWPPRLLFYCELSTLNPSWSLLCE